MGAPAGAVSVPSGPVENSGETPWGTTWILPHAWGTQARNSAAKARLGASNAGEPALKAIRDLGVGELVALGTFDLSPVVLEAIRDGDVAFAVDQQQFLQGYLPVIYLAAYLRYGVLPAGDLPTGPGFVTAENAASVIELSGRGLR